MNMKKLDGIYERKDGKYHYMGHEWTGFPSDGIWLVQDGKSNMSCLIGLKEKVSVHALPFRMHKNELANLIQKEWANKSMSINDVAKLCCDFFAEKVKKK